MCGGQGLPTGVSSIRPLCGSQDWTQGLGSKFLYPWAILPSGLCTFCSYCMWDSFILSSSDISVYSWVILLQGTTELVTIPLHHSDFQFYFFFFFITSSLQFFILLHHIYGHFILCISKINHSNLSLFLSVLKSLSLLCWSHLLFVWYPIH